MFKEVNVSTLSLNAFDAIGKQWMLITAGDGEKVNTMTASWGNMGIMWNKNIATCYIRPQRYTLEFVEKSDCYALCFMSEAHRNDLVYCGRVSGRDEDKIAKCGFTVLNDMEAPYFEEADTVLICKKIYTDVLRPEGFLDPDIATHYTSGDYHKIFMGEIIHCLVKE